ncbi:MAG: hypothetical protein L0387_30705 [Acidobacteria bacterium]|nr:hypothetical protein [Acidobacteriota bacterium]MCI0625965.1 hypothetical protein [Acidobacteriota bacterium]MCI0721423.1 hypothetical protein [Acidobacteriota bacterium]
MLPCSRKWPWSSAACVFLFGLSAGIVLASTLNSGKAPVSTAVLDNPKVLVNRVTYEPQSIRSPHTRAHDQVIVFLDDARYEAVYAGGKKETRDRRSGDVIWHSRGEAAPTLTNIGSNPYRTVVVNLK